MVVICGAGCVASAPVTDPLAGWTPDGDSGYVNMNGSCQAYVEKIPYGKAISDDVETFIKNLPVHKRMSISRSESYWIDNVSLFKDRTGQHAVKLHMPLNGTYINYVLIYTQSNVRTEVIKFASGTYRS